MLRILIATMAVVALAVPAMGYDTQWDGLPDGNLEIHLQLDCYIQIDWQDQLIEFDGVSGWYSPVLANAAYIACADPQGKFPTDPWAGDAYYCGGAGMYYESADGAVIFVRSNNDLSMRVHTNGDLTGTWPGNPNTTLPTWFTVCLAPFQIGGVALVGSVPFAPPPGGHYLFEASSPPGGTFGHADDGMGPGYDNWPDQYPFPCAPASQEWTLGSMSPYIQGTIKFLGRVHRHGLADPGDDYWTFLDVHFTTP